MQTKEASASQKTLHALGLCAKARKLIMGTPLVCEALRSERQRPYLVLTASDNSPNTAKRLMDKTAYYHVPLVILDADGELLAKAVGKNGRVATVAITDANLCRLVEKTLKQN